MNIYLLLLNAKFMPFIVMRIVPQIIQVYCISTVENKCYSLSVLRRRAACQLYCFHCNIILKILKWKNEERSWRMYVSWPNKLLKIWFFSNYYSSDKTSVVHQTVVMSILRAKVTETLLFHWNFHLNKFSWVNWFGCAGKVIHLRA